MSSDVFTMIRATWCWPRRPGLGACLDRRTANGRRSAIRVAGVEVDLAAEGYLHGCHQTRRAQGGRDAGCRPGGAEASRRRRMMRRPVRAQVGSVELRPRPPDF